MLKIEENILSPNYFGDTFYLGCASINTVEYMDEDLEIYELQQVRYRIKSICTCLSKSHVLKVYISCKDLRL